MKIFRFINVEDENDVKEYKSKRKGCEELKLTERLIDLTKQSEWDKYNELTPEQQNGRTNPRKHHKGYRLEVVEVDNFEKVYGNEESKAKYIENNGIYEVFNSSNKDNPILITKDELRQLKKLYCVDRLKINELSLKLGIIRKDLTVILNAFSIIHDDVPYIDEDLLDKDTDELVEETLLNQKIAYVEKLDKVKYKQDMKELNVFRQKDYFYNKLINNVSAINPSINFNTKCNKNTLQEEIHCFHITDEHCGLTVDSYFNKYNIEIMESKFEDLIDFILNNIPSGRIDIISGGDSIHGNIKKSIEKHSDYIIKSVSSIIKCYTRLFKTLLNNNKYNIRFIKANGSHESLEGDKTSRTNEENYGNLIFEVLKLKFEDYRNLEFLEKLKGMNLTVVPYFNYSKLVGHGDEMSTTEFIKFAKQLDLNVIYIELGHLHHLKSEEINKIIITYNEPLCGSDEYATNKGLVGSCGVRYSILSENGKIFERFIPL